MDIAKRIKEIIIEQLGVDEDEVQLGASFTDDLGADPVDVAQLIMAFEEEFRIGIPNEDGEKITTVQAAIDYVTHEVEEIEKFEGRN